MIGDDWVNYCELLLEVPLSPINTHAQFIKVESYINLGVQNKDSLSKREKDHLFLLKMLAHLYISQMKFKVIKVNIGAGHTRFETVATAVTLDAVTACIPLTNTEETQIKNALQHVGYHTHVEVADVDYLIIRIA